MRKTLETIGLEKKEIDVYLVCLQNEKNTPASLVRETGLQRSTLYYYLNKLKDKGLIGERVDKKRKHLIALPPKQGLDSFAHDKATEVERLQKNIKTLIPKLESIAKKSKNTESVVVYSGKKGVKTVIDQIVKDKKDIYWIGSMKTVLSMFTKEEFYKLMTVRRMASKTTAFAITDETILDDTRFSEQLGDFRSTKIIGKRIAIPAIMGLFGNKIAILSKSGKDIRTIIIEDETASQMLHLVLNALWSRI